MDSEPKAKDMREVFQDDPDQAKRNLLETARSIDWLAPLREHPFATVGISAALGAVAAANPKTVTLASGLVSRLMPLVEKTASVFLQAQIAKAAVKSETEPIKEAAESVENACKNGVH